MRLKKPLVGLAVACLATLSACGGGSSTSPGSGSSLDINKNNAGSGKDDKAVGPVTIAGATTGGVINVIGQSGDMSTEFDPRGVYYSDMMAIQTSLLVRTLTQWKWDPKGNGDQGGMVLVPDLATNLGDHNADYTQWTFHLKPGMKYSNGQPISSKDIAFSVTGSLDCDTFTDCPSFYFGQQGLLGMDKWKAGDPTPAGITTPDDNTIVFKFSQPFPDMDYYGFFPLFTPIPRNDPNSAPGKYMRHVVSTGPYMIKEFTPQKSLDLVRNPNWDPASDPARAALPDEWKFDTTSTDIKQQDAILLSDKGSDSISYDELDASDIPTFKNKAQDQIIQGPTPLTYWLAPDYTKVPLAARQALTWAFPYQAAAKAGGALVGINAIPTTTLIAPGTPGRQDVNPMPDHQAWQTDAAKAKAILQKANLVGFKLSWLYRTDDPQNVSTMKVIKAAYAAAGFNPQPVATTTTDYTSKRSDPNTPINIRTGGWFSDWPSGFTWMPTIFGPASASKPCAKQTWPSFGVVNYAKFCEDDINAKMKQIMTMPSDQQPKAWSDLEKEIQTKYYPVIPYQNGGTIQGHGKNIMGANVDNTGGMPTFKIIWVKH